jgi:hypothetical protein
MTTCVECQEKQGGSLAAKSPAYPCAGSLAGAICVPSVRAVDPALGFLGRGMIASGERLHHTSSSK